MNSIKIMNIMNSSRRRKSYIEEKKHTQYNLHYTMHM